MTEYEPEIEAEVIRRMRQLAMAGTAPYSILIEVLKDLGVDPGHRRLMAVLYFKEAFSLSLGEAKGIGAADVFGERLSVAEFNREIGPLIEAARERWAR